MDNTMKWGGGLIIALFSVLFAYQTSELIFLLYTNENTLTKILMVVSIDGFLAVWYLAKMFYRFKLKKNLDKCKLMWWVTFGESALCTFILMNFFMDSRLSFHLDSSFLIAGFVATTAGFIVNFLVFCTVVDSEASIHSEAHFQLAEPASKKN